MFLEFMDKSGLWTSDQKMELKKGLNVNEVPRTFPRPFLFRAVF